LWKHVESNIIDCEKVMEELGTLLEQKCGKPREKPSTAINRGFQVLKKVDRKKSREPDLKTLRGQLVAHQSALNLLLTAISMQVAPQAINSRSLLG
jgi:hypothetical protein